MRRLPGAHLGLLHGGGLERLRRLAALSERAHARLQGCGSLRVAILLRALKARHQILNL
jgi:hypothetical protein